MAASTSAATTTYSSCWAQLWKQCCSCLWGNSTSTSSYSSTSTNNLSDPPFDEHTRKVVDLTRSPLLQKTAPPPRSPPISLTSPLLALQRRSKISSKGLSQSGHREIIKFLHSNAGAVCTYLLDEAGYSDRMDLAEALVRVSYFADKRLAIQLVCSSIADDVRAYKLKPQTEVLFRSETNAMCLFSAFSFMVESRSHFLKKVLGPLIDDLCRQSDQALTFLEVDPSRIKDTSSISLESRCLKLDQICQHFFDAIFFGISSQLPQELQVVLTFMKSEVEEVRKKFIIGSVLFLRYICPHLAAPDARRISEIRISRTQRRVLVLITKVLQVLANNVKFGNKEEYMVPLNAFVERNSAKLDDLIEASSSSVVHQFNFSKEFDELGHFQKEEDYLDLILAHLHQHSEYIQEKFGDYHSLFDQCISLR